MQMPRGSIPANDRVRTKPGRRASAPEVELLGERFYYGGSFPPLRPYMPVRDADLYDRLSLVFGSSFTSKLNVQWKLRVHVGQVIRT